MSPRPGRRALAVVASAVVAVAVVVGMLTIGTPGEERNRKFDEKRVQHLMNLRNGIKYRFDGGGTLPASLAEMTSRTELPEDMLDPATGEPYGYERLDDSTFRLCATFDHATADDPAAMRFQPWAHRAGRQCYRFRIGKGEWDGLNAPLAPLIEEPAHPAP